MVDGWSDHAESAVKGCDVVKDRLLYCSWIEDVLRIHDFVVIEWKARFHRLRENPDSSVVDQVTTGRPCVDVADCHWQSEQQATDVTHAQGIDELRNSVILTLSRPALL